MSEDKSVLETAAQIVRLIAEEFDHLEEMDNDEKANYLAEIIADPADAAIPLPPILEAVDRPIIALIARRVLKEFFDLVWPEAA